MERVNGLFAVPTTVYDYLELISDLAIDYDGLREAESLMGLIDEMAKYAREAIKLIEQEN